MHSIPDQASSKGTWAQITGIKARRLAETKDLSEKDWKEIRKKYIGGSDIAAIAGVNPFQSSVDVYLDKMSLVEKPQNEKMKWGKLLEPVVAKQYAESHPSTRVQNCFAILQSSDFDFATANIDRLIQLPKNKNGDSRFDSCKGNGILEVKTTSWAKAWEGGEIPDMYYCQIQWYLGITKLQWADFAVLASGNEYLEFGTVSHDPQFFDSLLKLADKFIQDHIKKETPPIPKGHTSTPGAHSILYPNLDHKLSTTLHPSFEPLLEKRSQLLEIKKNAITQIDEINGQLLHALRNSKYGYSESFKVTSVSRSHFSLDQKAFKADHPKIYNQYLKESEIRYPMVSKRK